MNLELTLHNVRDDVWLVTLPNLGVPDFHIIAKSEHAAKDVLESYLYNALDGQEDVIDDDD